MLLALVLLAGCSGAPRAPEAQSRTAQAAASHRPPEPVAAAGLPSDRTLNDAATPAHALPAQTAAGVPAPAPGRDGEPPVMSGSSPSAASAIPLEAGLYRCELKRRVTVRRVAIDRQSIVISWLGKDTSLQSVRSSSGALRFESAGTGLVWIVITGKAMLLDSRIGKTLANECRI